MGLICHSSALGRVRLSKGFIVVYCSSARSFCRERIAVRFSSSSARSASRSGEQHSEDKAGERGE